MQFKAFEKMYLLQLQDLYSAGKQLVEALPKLIKTAKRKELKLLLKEQFEKNKIQLDLLEKLLSKFKNFNPNADNCDIVEEFLEEADEWAEVTSNNALIDVGLILLIKKINHYKLAVFESLTSYARILNYETDLDYLLNYLQDGYSINSKLDEIVEDAGEILIK